METAVDRHLARRLVRLSDPMARGFLPSLLLHGSIVAFLVLGPLLAPQKKEPLQIRPVMLIPRAALGVPNPPVPAKRASPARREEPKPAPEPEKKPEAKPEPPKSDALVLAEKKEKTKKAPPKRTEPAPAPPPETSPPPTRSTGSGSANPTGQGQGSPQGHIAGTAAFGGSVGIDDPNFRYNYYVEQMLSLIGAQWFRPSVGPELEAQLHFRLARGGQVSDLEVRESSGSSTFDLAAMRAVQNASPLPPLPGSYTHDSLGVTLLFR